MSDLRDKINWKKQTNVYLEQRRVKRKQSFSPLSDDMTFECGEERTFRACSQEEEEMLSKGNQSLLTAGEDGRSYSYRRRAGYGTGFSSTPRMVNYDDDIDLNYTNNKVIKVSASRSYEDVDVWQESRKRKEAEHLASRKIQNMAKEIKVLQQDLKLTNEENKNFENKLRDAKIKFDDASKKIKMKEDSLKHCENELFFSKGKVETERVFIKDLTFENKNNKEYISKLENEVKELKETKVQLNTENAQIRQLAKEISDDSDNLLKVIKELKAEKKLTDAKVEFLQKCLNEKDELLKVNAVNDDGELKVNVTQEEVNEDPVPHNNDQDYVVLDQV